jgi:hypothetical protein
VKFSQLFLFLLAPLGTLESSTEASSADVASYSLIMGFYEGEGGEPTESEVESLICQTNKFFQQILQDMLGDSELEAHAVNIDWTSSGDSAQSITVTFAVEATFGDGFAVPSDVIFQNLKLSNEGMRVFLEQHIWKSAPARENIFYNVNQLKIEDSTGVSLPPGKMASAMCSAEGASESSHIQVQAPQRNGTKTLLS